jgi:uncharacterized membrane protein YedE/YeeE
MIDTLRDIVLEDPSFYLATGGLVIGFVFGFIVLLTNFCTMGSISDFMTFGDFRRFRSWLLASATALIGAQLLHGLGVVDLGLSMYLGANLNWLGAIAGGLMFGFGMVLASGCASRNLARAGSGDIRALMVLIIVGLFAYMTIGGVFGPARAAIEGATSLPLSQAGSQSLASVFAAALALDPATASWIILTLVAGGLLIYCFSSAAFRSSPVHVFAGLGVGSCVVAGWALTGLAYDDLSATPLAPTSLSFVRPTGDAMEYLSRFTAYGLPSFAVAFVIGGLAGAFIAALFTGKLRLAGFNGPGDTARNFIGAALMGVGGVAALGCTVGQAITGLSTLAIGSFLAFVAIIIGGMAGIRYMERLLDG